MGANYAAECGIKCAEKKFQHFLRDSTKMPVTDKDEAGAAIRKLCRVESRAEFNKDEAAADRWRKAKHWFDLWQNGVGKNTQGRFHKPNVMGRVAFHRGTSISGNPFPRPDIDEDEDTDFDLWEVGWRKAARDFAST